MDKLNWLKEYQLLLFSIVIGLSLIICVFIGAKNLSRHGITVTGAANEVVKSDYATWRSEILVESPYLNEGYKQIAAKSNKYKAYLLSEGFNENQLEVEKITRIPVYSRDYRGNFTNKVDYYIFIQPFIVKSSNIEKINQVSSNAQKFLAEGVNINSFNPQFFYTKLDTIKIKLLKESSKNAKLRAEAMLQSTGNRVDKITSSKMGVFQITPEYSTEVSDYGINDTTSIRKKVTAVVEERFSIR